MFDTSGYEAAYEVRNETADFATIACREMGDQDDYKHAKTAQNLHCFFIRHARDGVYPNEFHGMVSTTHSSAGVENEGDRASRR